MFQAKRPRAGSQRPEIEKSTLLLVSLGENVRLLALLKASGEIRVSLKVVLVGVVLANERHT